MNIVARRHAGIVSLCALAWAGVLADAAKAQTATPSPAAPATTAAADAPSVQDIVVTAQKRSERLVNVPISVTAITAEKLTANHLTETAQLGQAVPGLRIDYSGSFVQPTLRGVGSPIGGPGLSSSVASYVDGIYRPNLGGNNFELADIESLQVLKGPQGTLFGRNATGGAIVITTADPKFSPNLRGTISYGRFNDIRVAAAGSTGITDTLAVGFSFLYHNNNGFIRNIYNGTTPDSIRNVDIKGKVLWKPTDKLSFLLQYEHVDSDDRTPNVFSLYEGRSPARDPATIAALSPGGKPIVIETGRDEVNIDYAPVNHNVQNNVTLRTNLDLDFADLVSYTGYLNYRDAQHVDLDGTPLPIFAGHWHDRDTTFSQELNLISKASGRLHWLLGLYFYRDKAYDPDFNASFGGGPFTDLFEAGQRATSYAAFADATYDLTDKIHITLGGRYSIDKLHEFFTFAPTTNAPFTTADTTFRAFTPRAVIRYNFDPSTNIYASFSKGYKSGIYNAAGGSTDPVRPEKIDAYELGFKTSKSIFRFNGAFFYYNFTDLQVTRYENALNILVNAAKARIYGADGELDATLARGLRLGVGLSWVHARYVSFPAAPGYDGTGAAGDPLRTVSVNANGFQVQRAPNFSGNVDMTYTHELGQGNLTFHGSYYRTTKFYFDPAHVASQNGYGLLNLRLSWAPQGDRWTISAFGNNVTDTVYRTQFLAEGTGLLQTYGKPATWGIELGFKF